MLSRFKIVYSQHKWVEEAEFEMDHAKTRDMSSGQNGNAATDMPGKRIHVRNAGL